MFIKKLLVVGMFAAGSAGVYAQGPLGGGGGGSQTPPPGGGGESGGSSMELPVARMRSAATVDLRPLAEQMTPYACVCAELQVDNLVKVVSRAKANPTSLPGLAEQTGEFLQNQGEPGEGGDGGDPEPPAGAEGGDGLASLAPEEEPGNGGDNSGGSGANEPAFAMSIPKDLEEQSPFPQPFQVSSIVNAEVEVYNLSEGEGGGAEPEPEAEDDTEAENEFTEERQQFERETEEEFEA